MEQCQETAQHVGVLMELTWRIAVLAQNSYALQPTDHGCGFSSLYVEVSLGKLLKVTIRV